MKRIEQGCYKGWSCQCFLSGAFDSSSLGSCSPSLAQDEDDAMSASSWTSPARWKDLAPKADPWIPMGRWATGQLGQRLQKKEVKGVDNEKQGSKMRVDETPQEVRVEVQGPKRRAIRVESEETQDHV